jgi:hypothetical protein
VVASLAHTVKTLQKTGQNVTSLFLNIKGGFDNVDPITLCTFLKMKKVNHYLIAWIWSSLTERSCSLIFQGFPRRFSPIAVGTPQGYPVSHLLFVIYVSNLHFFIQSGLTFSYVDDFALTVAGADYRSNIQHLQRLFIRLKRLATSRAVAFSVPNVEIIHWRTPHQPLS